MFNYQIGKYLHSGNHSNVFNNFSTGNITPISIPRSFGSVFTPLPTFNYNLSGSIFYPYNFYFYQKLKFSDFLTSFETLNSTTQNFTKTTNNLHSLKSKTNLSPLPTVPANFKSLGYNSQKGVALVNDAMQHRRTTPLAKGEVGSCAKYVKNAIARSGLGEYINGDAYECANIISRNKNFKEIKVSPDDFKNLPAGCVIVYPKGDAGYSSSYGHILITKGDGSSISQFASNTTKPSSRARVFMPV